MVHKLQKELLLPFDGQQDSDFTLCLVRVTTSLFGHTLNESLECSLTKCTVLCVYKTGLQ